MAEEETSNYAPRSPDLSSFYSDSPTQAAPQQLPSRGQAGYKIQPSASRFAAVPGHAESFYTPPNPYGDYPRASRPPYVVPNYHYDSFYPGQNPARLGSGASYQDAAAPLAPHHDFEPPPPSLPPPELSPYSYEPFPGQASSSSSDMPPRKAAVPPLPPPPAPFVDPSPVKTKFPTARIKRIMQADEEVGKVAQQTPIAVGKALELFMIQLVTKSADIARDKGSKRVTASMLKTVVETDEQWDFLREIVSRVETEKEGSRSKGKGDSDTDEEMEEPKKRGRGGGRRKKVQ
ncbi:DNA polymerase epsilon subunit C [Trichoderma austrokoningii]